MKRLMDAWSLFCWVCVSVTAVCWWILLAIEILHTSHGTPRPGGGSR